MPLDTGSIPVSALKNITIGEMNMEQAIIDNNFTYHKPLGPKPDQYESIRARAKSLAYLINEECPESREKSLAMTKLEECVMWANASIARTP